MNTKKLEELEKRIEKLEKGQWNYEEEVRKTIERFKEMTPQPEEPQYYRCMKFDIPHFVFLWIYRYDSEKSVMLNDHGCSFAVDLDDFRLVKKPTEDTEYWTISIGGELGTRFWKKDSYDKYAWKSGNLFNSEEEAEEMLSIINNRKI